MKRESGHGPGNAAPKRRAPQARQDRQRVVESPWPRLMNLEQAAAYLGIGVWTMRELINAGAVAVTRIERPRTPSALRHDPVSDTMRRLLIDRAELDDFADRCAKERLSHPWSQRSAG